MPKVCLGLGPFWSQEPRSYEIFQNVNHNLTLLSQYIYQYPFLDNLKLEPEDQGRPSIFSRGGKDSSPSPKGRRPAGLLMTTSGAGGRGRSPRKNFAFPPPRFLGGEGFSDPFLGKIDTWRTQFLRYMKSIIQVLSQDKKLLISTITTQ